MLDRGDLLLLDPQPVRAPIHHRSHQMPPSPPFWMTGTPSHSAGEIARRQGARPASAPPVGARRGCCRRIPSWRARGVGVNATPEDVRAGASTSGSALRDGARAVGRPQARTLTVLSAAQVIGGVGTGASVSVGALLAQDLSGSPA